MEITREVMNIQKKLEKIIGCGLGEDQALDLLKALQNLPMTITVLNKTKITMTVNAMKKKRFNENVNSLIKVLSTNWKKLIKESASGEQSESSEKSSSNKKVTVQEENTSLPIQTSAPSFPSKTAVHVRQRNREMLCAAIKNGTNVEGGRNPQHLARILEERIYKEFQKTDQKYSKKIHSLIVTLKDVRNSTLRISFLRGQICPQRFVKMASEEMASD
jgi:transcription elongation factor S-II